MWDCWGLSAGTRTTSWQRLEPSAQHCIHLPLIKGLEPYPEALACTLTCLVDAQLHCHFACVLQSILLPPPSALCYCYRSPPPFHSIASVHTPLEIPVMPSDVLQLAQLFTSRPEHW